MSERTWRIVTPEAVALDLEAAGLASRVLAALLDVLAFYVLTWALGTAASVGFSALGSDSPVVVVFIIVAFFLALIAWPVAWEVATRGRSLGKLALGIRVVTQEGAPIRFRHALVRGLVGVVELYIMFGTVALISALASRRFRRLGDHLAGTVVIRDRSSAPGARPVRFLPFPGWEDFAHQLDVSRLTPDHHRLVRAYLLRARELDPATRLTLGAEILAVVADATAMALRTRQALAAHDPVVPLSAVAAAYQRRFSPDPVVLPWLTGAPVGAIAR